jgi:hypothetical protein
MRRTFPRMGVRLARMMDREIGKIDVDGVIKLYEHHVILLTIEVGVRVLSY